LKYFAASFLKALGIYFSMKVKEIFASVVVALLSSGDLLEYFAGWPVIGI